MSSSGKGSDVHSLTLSILPILQGALKDGFGEAVMACGMPIPYKFPSLDSCQKRFLWAHQEIDFSQHPVVGLVLQAANVARPPQAHGFESLDPFLCQQAGSKSQAIEEDGVDKSPVQP